MIAAAQFTIISLCDVVTSDTPPENPYEGQLWVDTSVTPPETKIWDGNEWVVQNDKKLSRLCLSIRYYTMADVWNNVTAGMLDRSNAEIASQALGRWRRCARVVTP